MDKLVSIITPFYNAEKYLSVAISSVLNQSYQNWELLLINDGSTDSSAKVSQSFSDFRIKYFEQENKGVSCARNFGLTQMRGDFFCFLDADDMLPVNSILARLQIFKHSPDIHFVDGTVTKWDEKMNEKLIEWSPNFEGNPLRELLQLTGQSFFGPSWMIKKQDNKKYVFHEGLTHGEDLLFYAELARDAHALYAFTSDVVLKYRVHSESAMRGDLKKLENGYLNVYKVIKTWSEVSPALARHFKRKTQTIMFKSYLNKGQFISALKTWL